MCIRDRSNGRTFVYGFSRKGGRDPSTGELHDGYYCSGQYKCHGLVKVYLWNENEGVWKQSSEDIIGKTGYGSYIGEQLGYSVAITNQGDFIAASFSAEPGSGPSTNDVIPGVRFFKKIESQWQQIGDDLKMPAKGQVQDLDLSSDGSMIKVRWKNEACLLYTSPSPRDATLSRMPSSA